MHEEKPAEKPAGETTPIQGVDELVCSRERWGRDERLSVQVLEQYDKLKARAAHDIYGKALMVGYLKETNGLRLFRRTGDELVDDDPLEVGRLRRREQAHPQMLRTAGQILACKGTVPGCLQDLLGLSQHM